MILCAVDFSATSLRALAAAAAVAAKRESGLLLASVLDPSEVGHREEASRRLEDAARKLHSLFAIAVDTVVVYGEVAEQLRELATARGARLIVVSA
jgi:nucleotide-binding universal stress UspA family protein